MKCPHVELTDDGRDGWRSDSCSNNVELLYLEGGCQRFCFYGVVELKLHEWDLELLAVADVGIIIVEAGSRE